MIMILNDYAGIQINLMKNSTSGEKGWIEDKFIG